MILGVGTDIVEIGRVRKAVESVHFCMRVYTAAERTYCESRKAGRAASYAARFAGKEAVMKALGTGLRDGSLLDIEIVNDALAAPRVRLSGAFRRLAEAKGVAFVHLSLSHAQDYATAFCVLEGAALKNGPENIDMNERIIEDISRDSEDDHPRKEERI